MAVWRTVRRLAAAGLACGFVLAGAVHAQGSDDLAQLQDEVIRLYRQGRYNDALPIAERYVAVAREKRGETDAEFASAIGWLASVYRAQGRTADAEALNRQSLAIAEKALGPQHPDVATPLNNLAGVYEDEGRYTEAEPLYKRSLAIWEAALGPEHPLVGTALNNLAGLYRAEGRYAEAEPLLKRSLAVREKALGPEDAAVGTALNNLAGLYRDQGRYDEAEPLFQRSLAVWEKALGPEHANVGLALNNLAEVYRQRGSYAQAEPLYKRSLAVWEKALGPEHPNVALALNNLARMYQSQERYAEAEPLYKRSLAVWEKALGPEHPLVGRSHNNLALLYQAEGRYAEAEALYERSLAIREKALGPEHPDVAATLGNLAELAVAESDWAKAAGYWRRSTGIIRHRTERGLSGAAEGSSKGEAQQQSGAFVGLVRATYRLADGGDPPARAAEMFETAQWAENSEAAASLAQMAVRSAAGSPQLAALVRERQDLVGEARLKDKLFLAAKSQEPAKRRPEAEKALAERLAAIDARLGEIGQRLAQEFPDYAALARPVPLSVSRVQAQLRADEALVLFLDAPEQKPLPEETFVWVVTRSEMRWARSAVGTPTLRREVEALRCGLDDALWEEGATRDRCKALLNAGPSDAGPYQNILPFDLKRAHALYQALFGPVEDLIAGKQLLIVPSGALTQLPFGVLVTEPPAGVGPSRSDADALASRAGGTPEHNGEAGVSHQEDLTAYRHAAWFGARQPIAVLPAVSSLQALRREARASRAAKAYFGIGNPLLNGSPADAEDARLARARARCSEVPRQQPAALAQVRRGVGRIETRGGLANIALLKAQVPLPETAEEVCAVAHDLGADVRAVRLGARATEREVKRLSATGELAQYRLVHFATHGALAGQISGGSEPGLILTPPASASDTDDGYLSASEIAALKLDADWVILSACNTAAGGAESAEALSGLARAFIYAGARALLVSHWAVYSGATVKLVTAAVAEMARDPKLGRAEAMRRAMLTLIERGTAAQAHPSYWGPFVLVGEGAAGR